MSSRYTQHYQSGGSLRDIGQIYRGPEAYYRNQRGEGIGDFFATAYRFLNPLLQSGLSVLGNQAIRSGTNILSDLGKKDLGTIVREQGEQAIKNLSEKAINKIKRRAAGGGGGDKKETIQTGKGRRNNYKHRIVVSSTMAKKRGRKPGRKSIKTNSFGGVDHIGMRRGIGRNIRKVKGVQQQQIGGRRRHQRRRRTNIKKKRTTVSKPKRHQHHHRRRRIRNLDIFN